MYGAGEISLQVWGYVDPSCLRAEFQLRSLLSGSSKDLAQPSCVAPLSWNWRMKGLRGFVPRDFHGFPVNVREVAFARGNVDAPTGVNFYGCDELVIHAA